MNLRTATSFSVVILLGCVAAIARPEFVRQSLEPSGLASVRSVQTGEAQDLVILDGGLAQGFRQGMVAIVERENATVARVLIAASTEDASVGLILELSPEQEIASGDRVVRSILSL